MTDKQLAVLLFEFSRQVNAVYENIKRTYERGATTDDLWAEADDVYLVGLRIALHAQTLCATVGGNEPK
jgi:hypothetical protein